MSTDPSSSGRRRSCVSNDSGDGGDIRGGQDVDPPSPARGYSSWKNSSTVQVSSVSVGSSSGRRSARPVVPVLACQSAIARRSGREGVGVDIAERQVANPTTRIVFVPGRRPHFEPIACPLRLDRIADPLEHDNLRQAGVLYCCGTRLLLAARGHAVASRWSCRRVRPRPGRLGYAGPG